MVFQKNVLFLFLILIILFQSTYAKKNDSKKTEKINIFSFVIDITKEVFDTDSMILDILDYENKISILESEITIAEEGNKYSLIEINELRRLAKNLKNTVSNYKRENKILEEDILSLKRIIKSIVKNPSIKKDLMKAYFSEAELFLSKERFTKAIELYRYVGEINSGNEDEFKSYITNAITLSKIKLNSIVQKINKLIVSNDYIMAKSLIDKSIYDYPSNKELIALKLNIYNKLSSPDIWNNKLEILSLYKDDFAVLNAIFSPNGKYIISSSSSRHIIVWDAITGDIIGSIPTQKTIFSLDISADGKLILGGGSNGTVVIWYFDELIKGVASPKRKFIGHQSDGFIGNIVLSVKFIFNDKYIASASQDNSIRLWDSSNGKLLNILKTSGNVHNISISSDNNYLISASENINLWEVGKDSHLYKGHLIRSFTKKGIIFKNIFFNNDEFFITSSSSHVIKIRETKTGIIDKKLIGHKSWIQALDISNNNLTLASGDNDGKVILWDVKSGFPLREISYSSKAINNVSFSPDNLRLLTTSDSGRIMVYTASF